MPSLLRSIRFFSALFPLLTGSAAFAQTAPTPRSFTGSALTENFNALSSTATATAPASILPAGFGFVESGTNANTSYIAGDGSNGAGDTYSFGAAGSSERALGSLRSNSVASNFGVFIRNDSNETLTQFTVSYNGEQSRLGSNTRAAGVVDRLDFAYSTTATALDAGTYVDVNALDFTSPLTGESGGTVGVGAVSATLPVSATVTGLSLAPGATLALRFSDFDVSGADDGLAIDDFSFSASGNASNPTPTPTATAIPTATATPTATAAPTATPVATTSEAKISEFRFSGPGGPTDEFIEIYNASGRNLDVSGWAVVAGSVTVTIPAGTPAVPAFGHLLLTNSGYSLANYGGTGAAAGNVTYNGDIAPAATLLLRNPGGVVDQVTTSSLPAPSSATNNYSYVRRLDGAGGAPLDTGNDANDFNLVDVAFTTGPNTTTGISSGIVRLGAPGPENLSSPTTYNSLITLTPATTVPATNRVGSGNAGTLGLRYTVTNKASSGRTFTRLRFRVVAVTAGTTNPANPTGVAFNGPADLRLISSTSSDGVILPLLLQEPPTQANGGGLNSTVSLAGLPGGGLAPGQSITVEFLFNVVQRGNYRLLINLEPGTSEGATTVPNDDDNMLLGNPSKATVLDADQTNKENLLVEHNAYALGYQKSMGGPRWVSWHLDAGDLGSTPRGDFSTDPKLPADCRITDDDYTNSGYTRGHQCPSGDRTLTKALNDEAFYMSNMLPQTATLNNGLWNDFEAYCRTQAKDEGMELYIMSGGVGSIGRIASGKVNVPASCWKVAVILPKGTNDLSRINGSTRVLSILIPNTSTLSGSYSNYYTTVDNIESLTGLDLLSNLPDNIENYLEASVSNR